MKKFKAAALVLLLPLLCGCAQQPQTQAVETTAPPVSVEKAPMPDINAMGLNEDKSIYSADDEESVVCVYVTVQMGDVGSDTYHTFTEVNSAVRFANGAHVENDIYARAIVQFGDETGPLPGQVGYGAQESNATIRVRGNSSSIKPQKSYKLKLDKDAGLWRGQRNIALGKSVFDVARLRNKLYFDMLRPIKDVPSLRTQFVHLYIKDETAGETAFRDFGLFTQAEVPGTKYLANHGLDSEGYLYKAISFNFEPNDAIRLVTDPEFDQAAFDTILSCKGRQDHSKILEMIDALNDTSRDINEIFDTYFDRENYLTWMGYNILTANVDSSVQNFYLYSPTNSTKWYFIPWDGDFMLPWQEFEMEGEDVKYAQWEHGLGNWWGLIIHQRFFKQAENRQALMDKVDELYKTINSKSVNAMVKKYNAVVEPYVTSMPDLYYLAHTPEERTEIVNGLGAQVDRAYREFKESMDSLMPFWLGELTMTEEGAVLDWSEAYAFDYADITYHVQVSRYPDLRDSFIDETTDVNFLEFPGLEPGTWYWKITAQAEDGRTTETMNKLSLGDQYYLGVGVLEVP